MARKSRASRGDILRSPRSGRGKAAPSRPRLGAGDLHGATVASVAALLFLSGLCALVYQVAWIREFRLVFGASTAASSAVVAVFMGGLGIGNAVLGRRVDRVANPLRMYAQLELSVAVTVALGPLLIGLFHGLYVASGGQLAIGVWPATALRLGISALVLGPSTFLMGGTLPAAIRAATRGDDRQRRVAGLLYGVNTLGAVAGAIVSTYFALEFFGTRTTLWLACGVNVGAALFALALSGRCALIAADAVNAAQPQAPKAAERKNSPCDEAVAIVSPRLIFAVSAIAGFAFFLMELVWYRMLGPILGGTTFTFGLILAVALAGIGLGGALYALIARRIGK